MTKTTLWVVTPCYRDVPSFVRLRVDVLSAVRESHPDLQVQFVLVDDTAGYDQNIGELLDLDDVMIIEPPFNLGHQRALVYALRVLGQQMQSTDIVVTLDADGEDRPCDVPLLIDALEQDTSETDIHSSLKSAGSVVLAWRTKRHESAGFKAFYFCFRLVFRVLTGTVIRSGNFAAYRAEFAKRYLRHPHFDLCYSSTFISLGIPLTYVPCARGSRYEGKSRMNRAKLILHGLRMLMPFIDRIAARALAFLAALVVIDVLLVSAIAAVLIVSTTSVPNWLIAISFTLVLGTIIAICASCISFVMLAQLRGISQSDLEVSNGKQTGSTPS